MGRRKAMAVTHEDLHPSRRSSELGSKMGTFLIILTVLCGLCCFILCLVAESTRSQVIWMGRDENNNKKGEKRCWYSGSGKTPLVCTASAFLGMAVMMVVQHLYVLIAVSKSPPPALIAWDPSFATSKSLTFQAAFFFVSTWISFSVGEILLLIGLSVESGHLKDWWSPKESCLVIKEGLFSAAGVFELATVFLAAGLYMTAVRAQRLFEDQVNVRREVLESYHIHSSPPRSPPLQPMPPIAREDPVIRHSHHPESPFLFLLPSSAAFCKQLSR
ncbi:uncharacterized protein LOC111474298 [Cucurbita maxima]|uniref:Uncharacterized protein LOC111470898 n=1 Tax=Cucurbita maxima TaxID=3661 RepID=A0A6J1I898_CUCMA|nr:uncharacterized protein LOC111470898 [Cucurbita maxima]XP_022975212.1 uncharacterized protein LOC111474297 [Cucurbita maxima]XP_022975213.1 uncharacterized protein LOC111474298 [Cucurbita maxima]